MRDGITFGIAIAVCTSTFSASAQGVEVGYHGGSTRLDDGYYGTWIDNPNYDYAVCGGETPFLSGISMHEAGLWDNSALCSDYPTSMYDLRSYAALPQAGRGQFSNKVVAVSDCGEEGIVVGVAQPAGDTVERSGTPVLCVQPPTPPHDCEVVDMRGEWDDPAKSAWESGAPGWTDYTNVTCGAGRFARAVAYRQYSDGGVFVATYSWAAGGLICCSL